MTGGDLTLADLLRDVWSARRYVLFFAALFGAIAFFIVLLSMPLYKGTMIVAPADGYGLDAPEVRSQFTRESVLASDWYAARLDAKQQSDEDRLKRAVAGLYEFIDAADNAGVVKRLGLIARREQVQAERVRVGGEEYRAGLVGTLGVQIFPLTFRTEQNALSEAGFPENLAVFSYRMHY